MKSECKTLRFRQAELLACCPDPVAQCGTIRIQIRTEMGTTKWINIDSDELRAIEKILLWGES